jgi:mRNA-degrading endonuclease RelE of RelBE toxin-antitoxin system
MNVQLEQKPAFKRAYKKLHPNQREAVHAAIRTIVVNPSVGQEKKGDLAGVFVHKFDCVNQQYLLAYQWSEATRVLLSVGLHENFYRDLKH